MSEAESKLEELMDNNPELWSELSVSETKLIKKVIGDDR